jgi:subtilisin family serine protease
LPPRSQAPTFVAGEVLVLMPEHAAFTRASRGGVTLPDSRRAALFAQLGLAPQRLLGGRAFGGRLALARGVRPDFDPVAASAALRASGLVLAAIPDYHVRLHLTLPNDPYLGDQWYVNGGFGEVHLPEAWDFSHGSASVVIAIMDTGVDTGHPDLATRIWNNPGEIPGNGLDDDANGFVDDTKGWDFGDGDNNPDPEPMFDEIGLDEGFHGTFCAGIAAAATDNAEGIAGAGWNCRIMPLRIFDSAGNATSASIADAFGYAIDNGANVLSMSFGAPDEPGLAEFFQPLVDAAHAANIVCVASAGNDGVDTPLVYPAACANVLAIAATDEGDARAEFSNFGSWVDLAAPGASMWSTICRNYQIDDTSQIFYLYFFGWDGESPYMFGDGTSFACPLVSGVAGLVRASHPGLTADQVAAHLVATGDDVSYDEPIGPKLNAYRAVATPLAAVEDAPAPARLALAPPSPNPSTTTTRFDFALPRAGNVELAVFDASGRRVCVLDSGFRAAGVHSAAWDGSDAAGARVAAGLYFARLTTAAGSVTGRVVRLKR